MKKAVTILCGMVLVVLLTGCIVQSFYPFYTSGSEIKLPELVGEWTPVKVFGDDVTNKKIKPWAASEDNKGYKWLTYDKNGHSGELNAVFFKVGDQTFCDTEAGDVKGDQINMYWGFHVRVVHALYKVTIRGDFVEFRPLDLEWMEKAVESRKLDLPFVALENDKDSRLFTATTQQWGEFLAKYGKDKEAFSEKNITVLKRHATKSPETSVP